MLQAERTAETKKHRFLSTFEERRMKRDKLYKRLIKVIKQSSNNIYILQRLHTFQIDDETRKAIDRITNQRRKQDEFVAVIFFSFKQLTEYISKILSLFSNSKVERTPLPSPAKAPIKSLDR